MFPISTLYELQKCKSKEYVDKTTRFYGWVRRTRIGASGAIVFIDLYDGTIMGNLKCLAIKEFYQGDKYSNDVLPELADADQFQILNFEQLESAKHISDGCAVCVDGKLVLSPANASQLFELQVYRVRIIGGIDNVQTYPIQKSAEKKLSTLRQLPMFRMRSQIMQSIFRICSRLDLAVAIFMDSENVQRFDPNILTISDCEGAGDTFKVLPLIFSKDMNGDDVPVSLTVSSQLPLEAGITGLNAVYTAQKSFRSEKSDTSKHLAEFYHIEYERAFITLNQLLDFTERFVKHLIKSTVDRCSEDLDYIESKMAPTDIKSSRELLTRLLNLPFVKIKHKNAVDLINHLVQSKYMLPDDDYKLKRVKISQMPQHGCDLNAEHEKLLVQYFGWILLTEQDKIEKREPGAFVFVTHWPLSIKSFYMKQCDDGSGECESFDLLAPRVGELFGGSMREWRYSKLMSEIEKRQMNIKPIQWFIDLRKSGSMPHGGWGMGFARLCMLLTGTPSVRDCVAYPVYYNHCPY